MPCDIAIYTRHEQLAWICGSLFIEHAESWHAFSRHHFPIREQTALLMALPSRQCTNMCNGFFVPLFIRYVNRWHAFPRRYLYSQRTLGVLYGIAIYTIHEQPTCIFGSLYKQYTNSWKAFSRRRSYKTQTAGMFYGIVRKTIHEQLARHVLLGRWARFLMEGDPDRLWWWGGGVGATSTHNDLGHSDRKHFSRVHRKA